MSITLQALTAVRSAFAADFKHTVTVLTEAPVEVGPGETQPGYAEGPTFEAMVLPLSGEEATKAGQEVGDRPVKIIAPYGPVTAALTGGSFVRFAGADYNCKPPADLAADGTLVEVIAVARGAVGASEGAS